MQGFMFLHTDHITQFFPQSFKTEFNSNSFVRFQLVSEEIQKKWSLFPVSRSV